LSEKPTLRIPNWGSFQHYKNRLPPWIKLHRALLNNRHWHELTGEAAKLLIELWLVAAESEDGTIAIPTSDLAWRHRRSPYSMAQLLIELELHDFLDLSVHDAKTLIGGFSQAAPVILASTETETETEAETEKRERHTHGASSSALPQIEDLVAYVGEEHRFAVMACAQMRGLAPAWPMVILGLYGPGEKIDPTVNRIPNDRRAAVLALAMTRYAADADGWSSPYFRSFVEKAWMNLQKGTAEDAEISRATKQAAHYVPVIEERRRPAPPLEGEPEQIVQQLTKKFGPGIQA
jgi:hypothetical protein